MITAMQTSTAPSVTDARLTAIAGIYQVDVQALADLLGLYAKHGIAPTHGTYYARLSSTDPIFAACPLTMRLLDAGVPQASLDTLGNPVYIAVRTVLGLTALEADAFINGYDKALPPYAMQGPPQCLTRLGAATRAAVDQGLY